MPFCFGAFLSPPAPPFGFTDDWPLSSRPTLHAPPSAGTSGVRSCADLPPLATLTPIAALPKTERSPIPTSTPLFLVCHRNRGFLRTSLISLFYLTHLLRVERRRGRPVANNVLQSGRRPGYRPPSCRLLGPEGIRGLARRIRLLLDDRRAESLVDPALDAGRNWGRNWCQSFMPPCGTRNDENGVGLW